MGMDVYGKAPRSKAGEYFRNNCWHWRPLADYILGTVPQEITALCEHWHTNDGDGLGDKESLMLAQFLRAEMMHGRTAEYACERVRKISAMPREQCWICVGTGIRSDAIGKADGWDKKVVEEEGNPRHGQTGSCNACGGWGSKPAREGNYWFDLENVAAFCEFLEGCGGFEIR